MAIVGGSKQGSVGAVAETEEFQREVSAWCRANRPPEPDFALPDSFMEVDRGGHLFSPWALWMQYDFGDGAYRRRHLADLSPAQVGFETWSQRKQQ